jgi:hypothetical protein
VEEVGGGLVPAKEVVLVDDEVDIIVVAVGRWRMTYTRGGGETVNQAEQLDQTILEPLAMDWMRRLVCHVLSRE